MLDISKAKKEIAAHVLLAAKRGAKQAYAACLTPIQDYIREARHITNLHVDGYFPIEWDNEGLRVLMWPYREIIPLNLKLPHGVGQTIRKNNFSFTTNQNFEQVMEVCAVPRKQASPVWIRQRLKNFLRELHAEGAAHSVEIYDGAHMLGGALGLQMGAIFVALSVFSHQSGAGTAACAVVKHMLCNNGFEIFDSITPSPLSELFGGELQVLRTTRYARELAAKRKLAFPVISDKLPVAQYLRISQPSRVREHGRSFPR